MKYNINSDIPLPQSVLKKQRRRIHSWYEHHSKENKIPPYQFYYDGHLISLAFETKEETKEIITTFDTVTTICLVLSSLALASCIGVLTYYLYMSQVS